MAFFLHGHNYDLRQTYHNLYIHCGSWYYVLSLYSKTNFKLTINAVKLRRLKENRFLFLLSSQKHIYFVQKCRWREFLFTCLNTFTIKAIYQMTADYIFHRDHRKNYQLYTLYGSSLSKTINAQSFFFFFRILLLRLP